MVRLDGVKAVGYESPDAMDMKVDATPTASRGGELAVARQPSGRPRRWLLVGGALVATVALSFPRPDAVIPASVAPQVETARSVAAWSGRLGWLPLRFAGAWCAVPGASMMLVFEPAPTALGWVRIPVGVTNQPGAGTGGMGMTGMMRATDAELEAYLARPSVGACT
jgi:hypothetical protein